MQFYVLLITLALYASTGEARKRSGSQDDFQFVEDADERGLASSANAGEHRTWMLDPDNALCGLLLCGKRELCLLQDRFTAVCVNKAEVTRNGDKIVPLEQANLHDWNDPHSYDDDDDQDDLYDDEDDHDDEDYDDEDIDEDFVESDLNEDLAEDEVQDETKTINGEKSQSSDNSADEDEDADIVGKQRLNRRPFAIKKCQTCPVVRPVFLCGSDNRTYSSLCRLHYHNCIHEANVHIACKGFCPCQESSWSRTSKKDRQRDRKGSGNNGKKSSAQSSSRLRNKQDRFRDAEDKHGSRSKGQYSKAKSSYRSKYGKHGRYGSDKYNQESNYHNNDKSYDKREWGVKSGDVTHKATNSVWGTNECSQDALAAMGNRMLDWFSVIMSDARAHPSSNSKAPSWCKPEVAWMLGHLDSDGDSRLSVKELYQLEHDDRERCIKPFIDRCDLDRDVYLSSREWCKCFDKSERPCAALRRTSKGLLGNYIPECDSEGYYRPTQCHATASMCWCVDKHGIEIPGSRTRSTPNCDSLMTSQELKHNRVDDDAEDGDDTEEVEGSADMPLDI